MNITYRVMPHEYNYLVVTTSVLKHLNDVAVKEGYNRTILKGFFDPSASIEDSIEQSDRVAIPDYPVSCVMALPHYHKRGVLTMPHVRTQWSVPTISVEDYVSVAGTTFNVVDKGFEVKWVQVSLDIQGNTWENLPTIRPYAWLDVPEEIRWEENILDEAEEKFSGDANATIEDIESFLAESEKDFMTNLGNEEEE
tara:strand:- start:1388 stop:1975 length:588 start_codon:yes stop_codon:yes gene_type:complete